MQLSCLKCQTKYESADPDPYLCPSCVAEKNDIAAQIDRKFNTTGQQPSGGLAAYDVARAGRQFPKASALGL